MQCRDTFKRHANGALDLLQQALHFFVADVRAKSLYHSEPARNIPGSAKVTNSSASTVNVSFHSLVTGSKRLYTQNTNKIATTSNRDTESINNSQL